METKLPALEMVRRASKNKIGRFNKQDIRELCPTLSDSSIEGALRKLVSDGELKKEGRIGKILVTGCLAQRYQMEIVQEMPEVDGVLGTGFSARSRRRMIIPDG